MVALSLVMMPRRRSRAGVKGNATEEAYDEIFDEELQNVCASITGYCGSQLFFMWLYKVI